MIITIAFVVLLILGIIFVVESKRENDLSGAIIGILLVLTNIILLIGQIINPLI